MLVHDSDLVAVFVHIFGNSADVSSAVVLYPSEAGNPYAWLTIDDGFRPRCGIMFFGWLRIIRTHYAYLLIYIAFAVYDSSAAHLSNLVACELITGTADHRTLCTASLILDPAEAGNPHAPIAVDNRYCNRLGAR